MIDLDTPAIGQRIASYRKAAGFTAQGLATAVGAPFTRATVTNIESGRRTDLGVRDLLSIAWALGVPPVALVFPLHRPDSTVDVDGIEVTVPDAIDWFNGHPIDGPAVTRVTASILHVTAGLAALRLSRRRLRDLSNKRVEMEVVDHASSADFEEVVEEIREWEQDIQFKLVALRDLGVEVA